MKIKPTYINGIAVYHTFDQLPEAQSSAMLGAEYLSGHEVTEGIAKREGIATLEVNSGETKTLKKKVE